MLYDLRIIVHELAGMARRVDWPETGLRVLVALMFILPAAIVVAQVAKALAR